MSLWSRGHGLNYPGNSSNVLSHIAAICGTSHLFSTTPRFSEELMVGRTHKCVFRLRKWLEYRAHLRSHRTRLVKITRFRSSRRGQNGITRTLNKQVGCEKSSLSYHFRYQTLQGGFNLRTSLILASPYRVNIPCILYLNWNVVWFCMLWFRSTVTLANLKSRKLLRIKEKLLSTKPTMFSCVWNTRLGWIN